MPAGHRAGRKVGAAVVLVDGLLILYFERGGRTVLSYSEDTAHIEAAVGALADAARAGRLGKCELERIDGAPARDTPLGQALIAAGFHPTYRGLQLRA